MEFRTLAADSGWNDATLINAFLSGLSQRMRESTSIESSCVFTVDTPATFLSPVLLRSKVHRCGRGFW